jgi:hypothetical protein
MYMRKIDKDGNAWASSLVGALLSTSQTGLPFFCLAALMNQGGVSASVSAGMEACRNSDAKCVVLAADSTWLNYEVSSPARGF